MFEVMEPEVGNSRPLEGRVEDPIDEVMKVQRGLDSGSEHVIAAQPNR